MSITLLFEQARATLGLGPQDDAAAVKQAYRRKRIEHPPDRDPEAFRRIREAYELLSVWRMSVERAREALLRREPAIDPPRPAPPPLPGGKMLDALRNVVAGLDATLLLPRTTEKNHDG